MVRSKSPMYLRSMMSWRLTAIGSSWTAMGSAGNRRWQSIIPTGALTATTGIGYGRIAVGTGIRVILGAGHRSITVVGARILASVGYGSRTRVGDLRGS